MSNIVLEVKVEYWYEIEFNLIKKEISLIFQRCIWEKRLRIFGISEKPT